MINLVKGQKIDLTKGNSSLSKLKIGLGWDPQARSIDIDASVLILEGGKYNGKRVYFGDKSFANGAIQHSGDNLTGAGSGDDETILAELSKIPQSVDKLAFIVNIYSAAARGQNFGMVKNAYIKVYDATTNEVLCQFNLTDNYQTSTAIFVAEIYRHNGEWKFSALGEGSVDGSINEMARKYQ